MLNPLHQLLEELTTQGHPVQNLIDSNFHRNGFFPNTQPLIQATAQYFSHRQYDPDPKGSIQARKSIADLYQREGLQIDPEDILLTASSSESYSLLFTQLADPGDRILLPNPGYPLFEELVSYAGLEPDFYTLEPDLGYSPNLDVLESLIQPTTRFLILISPNNPTGTVISQDLLNQILKICHHYSVMVIFDEVFSAFLTDQESETSSTNGKNLTQGADTWAGEGSLPQVATYLPRPMKGTQGVPVFTINGISKLCASPDLKLSWLVIGPESGSGYLSHREILDRLENANDTYLNCSSLTQFLLPTLLEEVHHPQGVTQKIRQTLQANRRLLIQTPDVRNHLPCLPQGGIHTILTLKASPGDDEQIALDLLQNQSILVHPGYLYGIDDYPALVLSLLKNTQDFSSGIERLVDYLISKSLW